MSLYAKFKENIKKDLKEKLGKKNIHEVPQITKVVVSMWIWSLATRKWVKDFSDLEKNLMAITGQKPLMIKSRKAISNFKLRENMPVTLMVSLRREKAYDFIERLTTMAFPRLRDFNWITVKSFDGRWNYNLWFKSQVAFPELLPEEIVTTHWVQVTISTTADNNEDAKKLFESLGFIFVKK